LYNDGNDYNSPQQSKTIRNYMSALFKATSFSACKWKIVVHARSNDDGGPNECTLYRRNRH
jgi:hypothetical protein